MERSMSSLSQEALLSDGAMSEVEASIADTNIDLLMKDSTLYFISSSQELEYAMDPSLVEEVPVPVPMLPEVPSSTSKVPCLNEYPGPYSFDMRVQGESSDRKKWLFSAPLNKLFVNMFTKIPVMFHWRREEADLQVRALPVYTSEESLEHPVIRCPRHSSPGEHHNEGFMYLNHVIRSDDAQAQYHEDPESRRLSVVVPVYDPVGWVTINYTFTCKNSCSIGMARRSTAVIFTLERRNGEVVGRKVIQVRICSCPKRDKEKEENDLRSRVDRNLKKNEENGLHLPESGDRPVINERKKIIFENHDGKTFTWVVRAKRACQLARHATLLVLERANREGRDLTAQEKSCLESYQRIITQCEMAGL